MKFPKDNHVVYYKAHNGVSMDFRELITSAVVAGIANPITRLQDAGIIGFIDPARIIPNYKMAKYQHPKKGARAKSAAGSVCAGESLDPRCVTTQPDEGWSCTDPVPDCADSLIGWLSEDPTDLSTGKASSRQAEAW